VCIAYDAEAKVINNTFRYNVSSPLDVNCEAYVINNIFSADSSPTINTDTRLSALYNNAFDEISVIFNYGAFRVQMLRLSMRVLPSQKITLPATRSLSPPLTIILLNSPAAEALELISWHPALILILNLVRTGSAMI